MRSVIRYPGSKARLADWIIGHFPEHRSYLEPFLGSGAVLFQKPRSSIETVNDLDGEVINLFDCIRRDPERLAWEIYNTPYARETYEAADEPVDAYSRAIKLCIRANQGYGFRMVGSAPGWKRDVYGREKAYTARDWCRLPDAVMQAAERLRGVHAQYYEMRKYTALQIAAAFGVKPNQINDYEKSSYANSETQQLAFLVDTMLFRLTMYEQEITQLRNTRAGCR